MDDDFGMEKALKSQGDSKKRRMDPAAKQEPKEDREYIKAFETLPPQLLNVYGPGKWASLGDQPLWYDINQPLPSGAKCMSELCFKSDERRGVGINRWLQVMKNFILYQQQASVKEQNQGMLSQERFEQLYGEIERIFPSIEYCLAAKKVKKKQAGVSNLRAAAPTDEPGPRFEVSAIEINKHAKVLYDWVKPGSSVSYVRMFLHWQAGAGSSYVASTHHRVLKAFIMVGNSMHGSISEGVSLQEFQNAIVARHSEGDSGIEATQNSQED